MVYHVYRQTFVRRMGHLNWTDAIREDHPDSHSKQRVGPHLRVVAKRRN